MKILVDCVPLTGGGGLQVAIGVLAGLQQQTSVEWSAVVPRALRKALPTEIANDTRVTFVRRQSQFDRLWLTPFLKRLERRLAPDLVFTVFGPPFFRARAPHLVGFALGLLLYEQDALIARPTTLEQIGNWARCRLFRRADHIVVETAVAKGRLVSRIGIDPARVSVIPNGPNPFLTPLPGVASTRPFVILIPSGYHPHKNLDIVPAVAAAMRRRAPGLEFLFRLTLPEHSVEWRAIKEQAERLGVGNEVDTLGFVRMTELARAYHAATAVYLPTLCEISTAVYPESFLTRRPLVTTDRDFARELCGEGALFVRPRDPEEAADRLVELAISPERAAALVAAGSRQLAAAYPTPAAKFQRQLELMANVARCRDVRLGADLQDDSNQ